jgi:hypothetical protein
LENGKGRTEEEKEKIPWESASTVTDAKKPCVDSIEQPCVSGESVANLSASARKIGLYYINDKYRKSITLHNDVMSHVKNITTC